MAPMLLRTARALLLLSWQLLIPALISLVLYEQLLARTPGSFLLGAAELEGERRLVASAVIFVCVTGLFFYWRRVVSRLWTGSAGTSVRSSAVWQRRPLARAGLALALMGLSAVAALVFKSNHDVYRVQTLTMLPALKTSDEVAVNKGAYKNGPAPQRGDLVHIDKVPGVVTDEPIRRVIGLPGDRIEMKRGGFPIINGWEVPTCDVGRYFRWGAQGETNARVILEFLEDRAYLTVHVNRATRFAEYVVPPGQVFVLADNRNATLDSRNWKHDQPAGVPVSALLGRVDLVLLSKTAGGTVDTDATLRPPGLFFNLSGVDVSELNDGVQACLKARPKLTSPPKPGEASLPTNAALGLGP
jgi:signal peptidase I